MQFKIEYPLADQKRDYKVIINTLARNKILSVYPDWKQANMTARYVELLRDSQQTSTEAQAIEAAWDWVKAIRTESNVINANIDSATTFAQIRTLEQSFKNYLDSI